MFSLFSPLPVDFSCHFVCLFFQIGQVTFDTTTNVYVIIAHNVYGQVLGPAIQCGLRSTASHRARDEEGLCRVGHLSVGPAVQGPLIVVVKSGRAALTLLY